jgi:hypothetical protein
MIESQQDPSSTGERSRHFAIFAFLWALALLSHQVYYRDAFRSLGDVALTASALVVLLNPYSAWRLLAATGFHVLAVIYYLPDVFNHWFFAGLASLAFVVIAVTVLLRKQRLEPEALFPSFASVARFNFICLYYVSAFHKLNSDYFSLDVSCGVATYGQLREALPFLPASGAALLFATYLGLVIEVALPTLLMTRRLRRLGAVLGLLFHLCLGIMGYSRFSMISFALLVLFLPELDATAKKIALLLERNAELQAILSWLQKRRWLIIGLIVAAGIILANTTGDARSLAGRLGDVFVHGTFFFFLAESAVLIAAALAVFIRYRFAEAPSFGFVPAVRSGLLVAALMIFSGIAPYLGLHTLNTFAMYSNVRTEGGSSNHFVVPAGFQIFSYQRDLVDIVETNIASLQRVVKTDMLLPYQQLRVEITKEIKKGRKGIQVVFLRHGETISTTHAEGHPQLGEPLNAVSYKFLNFRAIEKSGGRACTY